MEIPKTLLHKTMKIGAITAIAGSVIGWPLWKIYSDGVWMDSDGFGIAKGRSHCHGTIEFYERESIYIKKRICSSAEGTYFRYRYNPEPAEQQCILQVEYRCKLIDYGCDTTVEKIQFMGSDRPEKSTPSELNAASRTLREHMDVLDVEEVRKEWEQQYTSRMFR